MGQVINAYGNLTGASAIRATDITRVTDLFIKDEHLVPAAHDKIMELSKEELQFFCLTHGIYSVPSIELVQFVNKMIPDKFKAIEVGSGNGVYARSLGIPGTDNYMQHPKNRAKFRNCIAAYEQSGQPLVQYGDDVHELDYKEAIRKFKPETVVMAWVTHKYNPTKAHLGGNMFGVDFKWIYDRPHVKKIILIGNEYTHENNPFMDKVVFTFDMPWIHSRSQQPDLDRVYVWEK